MNNDDLPSIQNILGGNAVWAITAAVLVIFFVFQTIRFDRITGEEIGLLLNKINGKTEIINQAGVKIYNGLTHKFFIFDKKIQTIEMTASVGSGDKYGKDDLKIKTIDGSDVYVDIIIQYKIDPDMVDVVAKTSGEGDAFQKKWARDYVRTIVRDYLGELKTEECYDSAKRTEKIRLAEEEVKRRVQPFGIIIDRIDVPKKPYFYKEYEEMIKKKKLADQAVLEEQSKAHAAKQKQQTMTIEETNKKNVVVEQFSGQMQQLIIEAMAEGEKVKKAADAYYDKATIGASAFLYQMQKNAEGTLARKKAEAEGIKELKKALEGDGGRNMVKMEYAKKLKDMEISAVPFTMESHTERFQHSNEAAASIQATK